MADTRGGDLQFDQYLTLQNLSPSSIRQYDQQVRRYERWCYANRIVPDQATTLELGTYTDTVPETWSSRKGMQCALRHYFRWAGRQDGPEQSMRVPRKPRQRPRPLAHEDVMALRDTALVHGGRQALATLCGIYLGARRSEIAALAWAGYEAGHMRWQRAKTGDFTVLPVHPTLAGALNEARAQATGMYLFPGAMGRPHVSPTTVWEWIRHMGRMAGVELTPHQLRHSWATQALQVTHDLRAVQEGMGHRDPSQTAGYAEVSEDQLRAVVDAQE